MRIQIREMFNVDALRLPLAGIRIADFSWVGAGPFMTKPLADHGADVVKIESRVRTDVIRNMPPFRDGISGVNRSGYFANRNSSKRSICLDLHAQEGRALALDLISKSDMVVNNFTPGTMDRLGLGYEDARAVRSDVIYLEMPMQGSAGPHSGFRGFGLSIAAAGGLYGLSGYEDQEPVGTGTNYPDHVPNPLHGAVALLAALRHRRKTGQGSYIELAQIESTVNVIGAEIIAAAAGHTVTRRGNKDDESAPHGVYPSAGYDRWIAIAARSQEEWEATADVLGHPEWVTHSAYQSVGDRHEHHESLDALVAGETRRHSNVSLADRLSERGVPAAAVKDASELVYGDAQLQARDHWVILDHPEMGPSVYDGIPYRLTVTPGRLLSPAPLLGEHSKEVCIDLLGVTEERYAELQETGIVG